MERGISQAAMGMLSNYGDLKDLEIQVQIIDGDPRQTLIGAIESHGAEMIVIGSRGVGAVKRYVLVSEALDSPNPSGSCLAVCRITWPRIHQPRL
jgi:hypothetical protein